MKSVKGRVFPVRALPAIRRMLWNEFIRPTFSRLTIWQITTTKPIGILISIMGLYFESVIDPRTESENMCFNIVFARADDETFPLHIHTH